MSRRTKPTPSPEVEVQQTSTTTDVETITIPGIAALQAFRAAGIVPVAMGDNGDIRETATMTVRVPGGGDWSNENLDLLDGESPIVITITQIKSTTS